MLLMKFNFKKCHRAINIFCHRNATAVRIPSSRAVKYSIYHIVLNGGLLTEP